MGYSYGNLRQLDDVGPIANYADPTSPKVAWILAYPKGGCTWLQSVIHQTTLTTTANNYGWTVLYGQTVNSRLIWGDRTQGPYRQNELAIPRAPSYVATKTHCGGWCFDCPPEKYWNPKNHFYRDCLISSRL